MAILTRLPVLPVCPTLPDVPAPMRVRLPFGIQIESPRTSMRRVPTLDEMLAPHLGFINLVLAPFAPIMVLGGVVVALIDTVKAVKDSISQLSPSPMLEAIENLLKKAQLLTQFIPGMPYVIMIRDIILLVKNVVQVAKDMIAEIVADLERIQTTLASIEGLAGEPHVQTVMIYARCGLDDIQKRWSSLANALGALTTLMCTLLIPLQILAAIAPESMRRSIDQVRCKVKTFLTVPDFEISEDLDETIAGFLTVASTMDDVLNEILSVLNDLDALVSLVIGEQAGAVAVKVDCFEGCP